VRYLALGDSFTAGTGARPDESFPARLADRWRARGTSVVMHNVAVNGYTTQDLIDRELPELTSFHPTLVSLAIGANDIVHGATPEQYRAQLRIIFRAVTGVVNARTVVALPQPDWSRSPSARSFGTPVVLLASIEGFNRILRYEATAVGGIDLFPRMREEASRGWIAADGLHPSAAAYDEWAADLAPALFE
jgi:lysophospholipase L1-like esterase